MRYSSILIFAVLIATDTFSQPYFDVISVQGMYTGADNIISDKKYDEISSFFSVNNWAVLRLDGTVGGSKRTQLVDTFNDPMSNSFAFLLSSKVLRLYCLSSLFLSLCLSEALLILPPTVV